MKDAVDILNEEIERLRRRVRELEDERSIFARTLDKRDKQIEELREELALYTAAEANSPAIWKEIQRLKEKTFMEEFTSWTSQNANLVRDNTGLRKRVAELEEEIEEMYRDMAGPDI